MAKQKEKKQTPVSRLMEYAGSKQASNKELMLEERRREVEADLEAAVMKGRRNGMTDEELKELFELIMEE